MLQKLRDQTQGFGFKVLVGVLIFVLAIFGFGAFNLFVTGEPDVATVNGEDITQQALLTATEREQRRLAMQLGEQFDPSQLDLGQLQLRALQQLIDRALLFQALDELGMDVSQHSVDESVRGNPAFQLYGR
jgi:peptidyl-prolyl cis-trans isomerase D